MRRVKKVQALGCAAAAVFGISSAASASLSSTLFIYEPFDYTAGTPITGQMNTSSAQPETWLQAGTVASVSTNQHQIFSGSLSSPPNGAPTDSVGNSADLKQTDVGELERLNIPNAFTGITPNYGANSTLYYSLLLNIPSTTGLTVANTNTAANNDIIIAINNSQGSQAARPNSWNGELNIRQGSVAGTYNLGIRAAVTDAGTTYFTGDLTAGVTHFIVVEAQLGATPGTTTQDTNSLWVDPLSSNFGLDESTRPAPDGHSDGAASLTSANDVMESILIGAGIGAGTTPNDVILDELRVGQTWSDVTTAGPAPEPSSLTLIGAGLMAMVGRRRRRCKT